jgi:hypothetical protein
VVKSGVYLGEVTLSICVLLSSLLCLCSLLWTVWAMQGAGAIISNSAARRHLATVSWVSTWLVALRALWTAFALSPRLDRS